jgi:hypothetical protein
LGITARILDQDSSNIAAVQKGLQTTPATGLPMAIYQESKIRHFHALLEQWLEIEPGTG